MNISIVDFNGNKMHDAEIDDSTYRLDRKVHSQIVKETICAHLAARRSGTACTKGRSEIAFSTRKPWRQKGTGNARAGRASSPIWRKGGVVFGPKPRDFSVDIPKQIKRRAVSDMLAAKIKEGLLIGIDGFPSFEKPQTKIIADFLKKLNFKTSVLFVISDTQPHIIRSVRNIPACGICRAQDIAAYDLIKYEKVLVDKKALDVLLTKVRGTL